MGVKIWSDWWKSGNCEELGVGVYYNKNIGSLEVPDGYRAKWYSNHQRTEGETQWFYSGAWMEMYQAASTDAKCLIVEECAADANDVVTLVRLGVNNFPVDYKLPVGTHRGGALTFPNDDVDRLVIPLGMTAEVFADPIEMGTGSLIFSGLQGGNHVDLGSFNYRDCITDIKVTADDWELAGIELQDAEIEEGNKEVVSGHITLHNNSDSEDTISGGTQITSEDTHGSDWNVNAGMSFSSETTIKGGVAGFGEFEQKFGLTLELAAGYGQNQSKSKGESFDVQVTMNVPAHSSKSATIIVSYGTLKGNAVRKWRNKRTGQVIEETGTVFSSRGYKAEVQTN